MIIRFCDACGKEQKSTNNFQVPCHLYSLKHKVGYVDNEGNHVSGRMDSIDLCNRCENVAYTAALEAIGLPK